MRDHRERREVHHGRGTVIPPGYSTNSTNGTSPQKPDDHYGLPIDIPGDNGYHANDPEACPTAEVIISTTTVDVTVYVTPPSQTEDCDDEEGVKTTPGDEDPHATKTVSLDPSATEPCDDDDVTSPTYGPTKPSGDEEDCETTTSSVIDMITPPGYQSTPVTTLLPVPETTETPGVPTDIVSVPYGNETSTPAVEEQPTPESSTVVIVSTPGVSDAETTPLVYPTPESSTVVIVSTPGVPDPETTPLVYPTPESSTVVIVSTPGVPDAETTPLVPGSSTEGYGDDLTPTPVTTYPIIDNTTPKPTEDCVIDTTMLPAITATIIVNIELPAHPTATVCVHDDAEGEPEEDTEYCGVHGEPAGTYFIAEFIEQRPGEAVTEEGCYQFCDVSFQHTLP